MAQIDLKPILQDLINRIGRRSTYSGNTIPQSVMDKFEIEEREDGGAGILVPYWIPVVQKGRGPRRNTKDHGLWQKIYRWMAARGMFKSKTEKGRINEAKSLTWYINKYGNKHFRSGVFIDIYKTERERTIEEINEKFSDEISRITMEVI